MKKNLFGEAVLQPGDDIFHAFYGAFETDSDESLFAIDIEEDSDFGWVALIQDENGNEMAAHDFKTREELEAWLTKQSVELSDG